jgi:hypothetical protein
MRILRIRIRIPNTEKTVKVACIFALLGTGYGTVHSVYSVRAKHTKILLYLVEKRKKRVLFYVVEHKKYG